MFPNSLNGLQNFGLNMQQAPSAVQGPAGAYPVPARAGTSPQALNSPAATASVPAADSGAVTISWLAVLGLVIAIRLLYEMGADV